MIKILLFAYMMVSMGTNDCLVEEAIVYEDASWIQRLFKSSSRKKKSDINISFGYGFGDKLKVVHNDSVVFSYYVDKVEDPGISFNLKDSKGLMKVFMEKENVCTNVNLLPNYEYLLITRFQKKWYFTFSHKKNL
jgi:hypothetical protein